MTKIGKTTKQYWATAFFGLLLFGAASFSANAAPPARVPHELVPHIVLPDTIQYNKTAQKSHPTGLNLAGYGMVSPFVATYTPFPSYQLPAATLMSQVGQAVYPVAPAAKPLPLPKKSPAKPAVPDVETPEQTTESNTETAALPPAPAQEAPILLASNTEEVVPAAPLAAMTDGITQTGIFCQKPAKPPAAWSFNSPIFKAASIPMPWGGAPGFNGYINQFGAHGTGSQIGFVPQGGQPGGEMSGGIPYQTFQMGSMGGHNPGGVQTQVLPNGMILLTAPADHAGCGLLRCRSGAPRMMVLPGNPNMPGMQPPMPGMMPQPPMPTAPVGAPPQQPDAAMFYGNPYGNQGFPMMQQMPQTALQPITAMTPYGLSVVGYQPATPYPAYQPPFQYGGMGMMPAAQWQALQQMQAAPASNEPTTDTAKTEDAASGELKAPLPINAPGGAMPNAGLYATPFPLYAGQVQGNADAVGVAPNAGSPYGTNPLFFQYPQFPQQQFGGYMPFQQPMFYQTPYGLVAVQQPMSPYGMPQYGMVPSPYGMMQSPFMPVGMGGGSPFGGSQGVQQGGLSMSDVIQLMLLLRDNQPPRRRGLFGRIADRRAERRERSAGSDPFAQLMQAWSTPYGADGAVRMPARNAYPYGYFGAQVGAQDTANYGGYYNLYMGSTGYPGLY